jgi:hypothetical protein
MFRLFRSNLLLHIIVCKTSRLKFSFAVDLFSCAIFKEFSKPIGFERPCLTSTRSVCTITTPLPPVLESDSTPLLSHSFCSLSYDRPVASSKASSPKSAI